MSLRIHKKISGGPTTEAYRLTIMIGRQSGMKMSEIPEKNPSKDLILLIETMGKSIGNLGDLIQKVKQKGREEGFSDFEIILLSRKILAKALSRRQMNYWLPMRSRKSTENSSIHLLPPVKNVNKKDSEESHLPQTLSSLSTIKIPPQNIQDTSNEGDEVVGQNNKKGTIESSICTIQAAELPSDPVCANGSNSESNGLAQQNAERRLQNNEQTNQIKVPAQGTSLSPSVTENVGNTVLFQISKDCDFMNEHFKPRINPLDAIAYLQQFVGKFRKIDFGFRVIE